MTENNIERFVKIHKEAYHQALIEIQNGKKESHWMWYIFPQLASLSHSPISQYYGIKNLDEAKTYLKNETLKKHLIQSCEALLKIEDNITNILGTPDDLKLKSCMTLFSYVAPEIEVFSQVLEKFYQGEKDNNTISRLK